MRIGERQKEPQELEMRAPRQRLNRFGEHSNLELARMVLPSVLCGGLMIHRIHSNPYTENMTTIDPSPSPATQLPPAFAIQSARQAGYSDAEIHDYLSSDPRWSTQFAAASQAGYTPTEVLNHLRDRDIPKRAQGDDNTSFANALAKGASDVVSGVGKTAKVYLGSDDAASTLDKAASKIAPSTNYKSATETFLRPEPSAAGIGGFGWRSAPRALFEGLPGVGTDLIAALLARRFGGNVAGALGGMASYGLRSMGGEAESRAQHREGKPDAQPTSEDKAIAAAATAAQAGLNQVGLARLIAPARVASAGARGAAQAVGNAAKTAAVEGATNAAQDVVSQVGQTIGTDGGVSVDPKEALGSGVLGGAAGAALGSPRLARDLTGAARFRDVGGDDFTAARAAIANRIIERAGGDPASLKDPNAAYRATTDTQADVINELRQKVRAVRKVTTLTQEADNALNRAQRGQRLTDGDLSAINDAVDGTPDADGIKALAAQATVLSRLKAKGDLNPSQERFGGGVSDKLRRTARALMIPGGSAYGAAHVLAGSMPGASAVVGAAPAVAATAVGAYGAIRGAERTLGLTSPAHAFVEKFADGATPMRPTTTPPNREPQRQTGPIIAQAVPARPWGDAAQAPTGDTMDTSGRNVVLGNRVFRKVNGEGSSDEPKRDMRTDHEVADKATQDAVAAGVIPDMAFRRARYHAGVVAKRESIRANAHAAASSPGYTDADIEAFQPFLRRLLNARTRSEAMGIVTDAIDALPSVDARIAVERHLGRDFVHRTWKHG